MKTKIVFLILALRVSCFAEHDDLFANPRAFHNRQTSVIGLALVEGDRFYLFKTASAASKVDVSQAIFVRVPVESNSYDKFNNRWVRLIGFPDANAHGPFAGFSCEFSVKKVELINRPAETLWPSDVGEFKNETGRYIRVFLSTGAPGRYYAIFGIVANEVNANAIRQGTVVTVTEVRHGTENDAPLVPEGNVIAKIKISVPPRTNRRDEPVKRVFYYRITDGDVQLVRNAAGQRQD